MQTTSGAPFAVTAGDGVFEAVKVRDGKPFALTRHLDRLLASASGLGLPAPDPERVRQQVAAVLADRPLELGRLRITWTAGASGRPELAVIASPMAPHPPGAVVVRVPWPRNERSAVAGLKTTAYAENVVALAWARARGADEAVFATTQGDVCEGTGSNLCYVVDGEARTPSLASGCLPGVTRALVIAWCGVREVDEPITVLDEAEELFLVSTTRDVQPVVRLDDREFVVPGPVTRAAMRTWGEREAADTDP